jgi:hypothetical protein
METTTKGCSLDSLAIRGGHADRQQRTALQTWFLAALGKYIHTLRTVAVPLFTTVHAEGIGNRREKHRILKNYHKASGLEFSTWVASRQIAYITCGVRVCKLR